MKVYTIAPSCNIQLLKNEKTLIKLKASKLKANRMQVKMLAIESFTFGLIDNNFKKSKKKETALNRRLNSK